MATVSLARDTALDRLVAVKVLSDVLAEDPAYVARFRREAHLAARLSHPNLVRIFDFSAESERPYLVMEYIDAGTLADRIAAGRAGEIVPRRLAHELLGALARIHDAGVVHRDVKPSNVLLDREGRARLTDFGIAEPHDATKLTRTGEVIGTLKYMAPEVREGKPATPRSDLYSCGVLLGQCLENGRPPELGSLVGRLTRADPGERPASAGDALALLDTGAVPTEVAAPLPPFSPADRGTREIHLTGRRILVALAALALGAIIAALALGGAWDNGSGGRSQTAKNDKVATSTSTATTTSVETTTAAQVQPPPTATGKPATAGPLSCGGLAAQQASLEEQQKAAEERLKDNPPAREQSHAAYDAKKKALEGQLKSCEAQQKAAGGE
jgi:serine/threonine-protein kinase